MILLHASLILAGLIAPIATMVVGAYIGTRHLRPENQS